MTRRHDSSTVCWRQGRCRLPNGLLTYLMIQLDAATEADAGHDEANRVSTRVCGSYSNPVGLSSWIRPSRIHRIRG